MQQTKNIILADDHVIVRNGLKELIHKLGPYQVVGEYNNGKELIADYPFSTQPDLLILDYEMPEMDGAGVMNWIKTNKIDLPVLLLTLNENEAVMIQLFRLGMRGYLHKNCSSAALKQAIDDILRTGYYHDEMLTKALMADQSGKPSRTDMIAALNDREREFLRLVCDEKEYTYEEIANMMHAHRRTVDKYRESIFEKFGVKSKTGLVLFAVKNRLVEL